MYIIDIPVFFDTIYRYIHIYTYIFILTKHECIGSSCITQSCITHYVSIYIIRIYVYQRHHLVSPQFYVLSID